MKTFFYIFTLLNCFLISAQNEPTYEPGSFAGRYVEWKTTGTYHFGSGGANLSTDIKGFWTSPFHIDLYVHKNVNPQNTSWGLTDIKNAIDKWNNVSSIAKLSFIQEYNGQVNISVNPGYNQIFKDEFSIGYPSNANNYGEAVAFVHYWAFYDKKVDCNNWWGKGPIIFGGFIAINPDRNFYFSEYKEPAKISFKTTVLHELGHLLGINHISGRNNVMFKSIEEERLKTLTPRDIEAINRLYGYDGLNNNNLNDPKYSSIKCTDFKNKVSGLIAVESDGTTNFGTTSNCSNCFTDAGEYGIDCGGTCNNSCEDMCNSNTWDHEYIGIKPTILNYTVVRNNIGIGNYANTNQHSEVEIVNGEEKYMRAGSYVEIGSDFEVKKGGYLTIDIEDCDCPNLCKPKMPNVLTPNCDGINDIYYITVNGATSYQFEVYPGTGGRVYYSKTGNINNSTNRLNLWNGVYNNGNMCIDGVYRIRLVLYSNCSGESVELIQEVHVIDSDDCNLDYQLKTDDSGAENKAETPTIQVWPNILSTEKTVNLKTEDYPNNLSLEVYDQNGQFIEKHIMTKELIQIDFSNKASGLYMIVISKFGEIIKTEKIINTN